jgi:hydroxymethylpyrimidine/phosphomethylpyrimidine kinase
MSERKHLSVALSIAGSDSGGGAGIQADLKTFASLGVHGASAITCLTAQNPKGVLGIQPCSANMLARQLEAVMGVFSPAAIKTGMLYSAPLIDVVAGFFEQQRPALLVVDPVMVATSGGRLLKPSAIKTLCQRLLPISALVTPNLREAEVLTGSQVVSVEDLRAAARELRARFGCAALVKGGHLRGLSEAVDIFYDGQEELLLSAPFVRGISTHGTGCTYSAAVTAYLARGCSLAVAVRKAKEYITQAIAQSQLAAGYNVLNSFWK